MKYINGNQGRGLRQAQKCVELKLLMGFQTLSSLYLDLQGQYIYKETMDKPAQIRSHSTRLCTITKMKENINICLRETPEPIGHQFVDIKY